MASAALPDEAVRAVGLTKAYANGTLAVDRIELSVRRGEVLGLLGPNGAGKTTTVGMLTTRVRPTAGRAWIGGVDVVAQPSAARRLIGVVSQRDGLDRALSVRENLVFHGRYFGMSAREARAEAEALLERFGLADAAEQPVATLSGGMARRLAIARAIMHRPAVLFLDEPTASLDPRSRLAIHELVRELKAEGQTIVLVTHDLAEAERLSDRVAILDRGCLLAHDAPAAIAASDSAHDGARRSLEEAFLALTGREGSDR